MANGIPGGISGMTTNVWLNSLPGLCFGEHSMARAAATCIDAQALKGRVAQDISRYIASDIDVPAGKAEARWLAYWRADREHTLEHF